MSPQMKAILLSFKNLPFERFSSKDVEILDCLDRGEKFVDSPIREESFQSSSSSPWRNKVSFSRIPENNSQSCQVENISSTVAREKGKTSSPSFVYAERQEDNYQ